MCKFDEICVDEKCNVKYKNKHPVLIEPFSVTVVPFDFIELIRKKYYKAEFRNKKCRYEYDSEIELFYINCENKNINLTFLNGNEGLTALINCIRIIAVRSESSVRVCVGHFSLILTTKESTS